MLTNLFENKLITEDDGAIATLMLPFASMQFKI